MSAPQPQHGEVTLSAAQFTALQEQLAALVARVDQLEGDLAAVRAGVPLDHDVVLAISAAVAAYLGKRATVKQVRLHRASSWSAQGRASHQQSHSISLTR